MTTIPGDTSTNATLSLDAPTISQLEDLPGPGGDADWFRVIVPEGLTYAITMVRVEGAPQGQVNFRIRDEEGTSLRGGGVRDEPLTLGVVGDGGKYYASASSTTFFDFGSVYEITVDTTDEELASTATEASIALGEIVEAESEAVAPRPANGIADVGSDLDWFRTEFVEGEIYTISARGIESADLRVRDDSGEQLVTNSRSNQFTPLSFTYEAAYTGTHYIEVAIEEALEGALIGGGTPYTLSLSQPEQIAAGLTAEVQGDVDVAYFSIDAVGGIEYTLDASSEGLTGIGSLSVTRPDGGAPLAGNDDLGTADSFTFTAAQDDRLLIEVRPAVNAGVGEIGLSLTAAVPDTPEAADAQLVAYLYEAALDRNGNIDLGGLNFWIEQVEGGFSFVDLAEEFLVADEFEAGFGNATDPDAADYLDNAALVDALYTNVLDRTPDPDGLAFWLSVAESGSVSRAELLLFFAESPENIAGSPQVPFVVETEDGDWVFA